MNILSRWFAVAFVAVTAIAMPAQSVRTPDFAFPQQVISASARQLAEAEKKGDARMALRAVMDNYLAQAAIGQERVSQAIAMIDSIGATSVSGPVRDLSFLLQAEIYTSLYMHQSYIYEKRTAPLLPLPGDYREWTGEQFRFRIVQLLDSAMLHPEALREARLSDYSGLIMQDARIRIYYPDLYCFVANKAIDILRRIDSLRQHYFPFSLLRSSLVSPRTAVRLSSDPGADRVLALYDSLIMSGRSGSAPVIAAEIARLGYMLDHMVLPEGSDMGTVRIKSYLDLYRTNLLTDGKPVSEYAGDILSELPVNGDISCIRTVYDTINSFLKVCPRYWRKGCLESMLMSMRRKDISVVAPSVAAPGREVEFAVTLGNLTHAKINIYDVSSSPVYKTDFELNRTISKKPISSIPVMTDEKSVPFECKEIVKYTFTRPGTYIAVPVIEGEDRHVRSFSKINVTGVALSSSGMDNVTLWAVSALDGAPLSDVDLTLWKDPYRKQPTGVSLGSTDRDGAAKLEKGGGLITASYGDDRFAAPLYVYSGGYTPSDKWTMGVQGYSSLPVYHPGDSVAWCAVCYEYKCGLKRLYTNRRVEAVLIDATGSPVDTLAMSTDGFGRVSSVFMLPEGLVTGRYSIKVGDIWGAVSFNVDDYKLPSFRIELSEAETDFPSAGYITLRGKVMTYAGFPVEDARIGMQLSVSRRPRWWWAGESYKFYSADTVTMAGGEFRMVIAPDVMASAPVDKGFFTAVITATSPAGESREASLNFALGSRYRIAADIPAEIDRTAGRCVVKARVYDYRDSVVDSPVDYSIMHGDSIMLSGRIDAGTSVMDIKSLSQGRYKAVFTLPMAGLADTLSSSFVIYDPSAGVSPVPDALLWFATDKVTVPLSGESASWLCATGCDTHLLVTLWSGLKILSQRWVKAPAGYNTIAVALPAGVNEATMTVSATGDYRTASTNVSITRADSMKGLKFTAETFRDRVVPGAEETWVFRVSDMKGEGREAAVLADLYDTAIDAIASSQWNFNVTSGYVPQWRWNRTSLSDSVRVYVGERDLSYPDCPMLPESGFETYGRGFGSFYSVRPFDMAVKMSGGIKIRGTSQVTNLQAAKMETAYDDEAEESMVGAVYEVASMADGGDSAGDGSMNETSGPPVYRDGEEPLAFFRSTLTTAPDGSLELKFTVPEANTTWGFRAVAFTDSLISAKYSADVVASRPIMVQPNLPRFIRTGDKVLIQASVMNATDSAQFVTTGIEIFNPSDGKVMQRCSSVDTVAPSSMAIACISVEVPSGVSMLGYRIRSTSADGWGDGEQDLIPVLPATTPVIDTYPFYMGASTHNFDMLLPDIKEDATVTLQFCANPVWYVITALPGILDTEPSSAPEAARAIFSASVASGLYRDNPRIADAMKEWIRSDKSGEMLTSMLERNEDLKMVLLQATPWMSDAADDTERMTRLSMLFDRNLVDRVIKKNIALLKKLEAKAGWAWCTQYPEASEWATRSVLGYMADLCELGFLPDDKNLREMINRALKWDNTVTLERFRKYPKDSYTWYVYLHDRLKGAGGPEADSRIVSASIQAILSEWKKASLPQKAVDARVLYAHGYRSMASTVLASIREYAEISPDKGMWFPSLDNQWYNGLDKVGITSLILDAFHLVEPGCAEVDLLRQWLIYQKGSMDWGSSTVASHAVAAILSTSSSWIVPAGDTSISVDDTEIKTGGMEKYTGEITVALDPTSSCGAHLRIDRKADTPSWGAVFCRYSDEMTSIKGASCPELSIDKTMIPSGNAVSYVDKAIFAVGDRVTVNLTLKVNQDMDYVVIVDDRPACLEPVDQLSTTIFAEGLRFYRENRDASTRIFIDHLPKGVYQLSYDMWVNNGGSYTSGIATVQSQYAPKFTAHSGGGTIEVSE